MPLRLFFLLAFIALCPAPPVHAAAAEMPRFANELILAAPSADAEERVHEVVVDAANSLGWKVAQDTPRLLRLEIIVRNQYAVIVNVLINIDMVDVEYVSSINMGYRKNADGHEVISPAYGKWVVQLLNAARQRAALLWSAPAAQPAAAPPELPTQPAPDTDLSAQQSGAPAAAPP
ncbi:MAG: hypothetical protein LBU11_12890 [Zoogloeaceae bacterium]|nr:hypothetical protein [Zoogloeaceae bacterium]